MQKLTLETGRVSNKGESWVYFIFTEEEDPNYRVEIVIYNDGVCAINNIEETLFETLLTLSKLLLRAT